MRRRWRMAATKSMTPEREGEFAAASISIVELYWMTLDPGVAERARFARMLSPDERRRAERFRFPRDRWRYVVRRGRLRELLAIRLGCTPAEVPLSCNGFGKPRIEPNSRLQSRDLRFSLSHSGGLALYAIAGLHAAIVAEGSAWQLAPSPDDGLRRCDDGSSKIGGPEHRRPTRVH